MRAVLQRVSQASVTVIDHNFPAVGDSTVGAIRKGVLVLIGVGKSDTTQDADYILDKIYGLRIFPDEQGKMNRDVREAGGALLLISQFTLYGDCRKGRRPSFDQAAPPDQAKAIYDYFVETLRRGSVPVETGVFQAMMEVHLVNQGPVTILVDSDDRVAGKGSNQ